MPFTRYMLLGNQADSFPPELFGDTDPESFGRLLMAVADPETFGSQVDDNEIEVGELSPETIEHLRQLGGGALELLKLYEAHIQTT